MVSLTSSAFKESLLTGLMDNETLNATCQEIASEIQSGHRKLYAFVEELGPFVTDKSAATREKGIDALSSVLMHLPKAFLNETELDFITTFYCDRLKDHHSIIPVVLKGIVTIVQMKELPRDAPSRLFRSMFEHVQCQSQLLPERRNIYLIFTTLLQNRIEDLKAMGPDFVYGVLTAIDGERDPRNLMLLFAVLPSFMREFPLGHLTEEMFEVIACYFPVDFNPSGSDGLGITREDLAEKLAPCLYAIPEFAEFCLPLILEKLFSSLKVAKLDSLHLLGKAAQTFGTKGLKEHLTELWSALRKEVMPGGDLELKTASLKALKSVIEVISTDSNVCETFIDKIITDTSSSLCDVQLSLFRPAEQLLEPVATINKQSCTQVLRQIVPLCLGQYSTKTLLADKVILTETLNNFIQIGLDHGFSIKSVPELSWTDIPQMYLGELSVQDTELKTKILLGLTIQKANLTEIHRNLLYDEICTQILTGSEQIRRICCTCFLSFAITYPSEISTLIKERLQLIADGEKIELQTRKLEALSAVAKTRVLGIEVLPQIVSQTTVPNSEISFTALTCLHRLIVTKSIDFDVQNYLYSECSIIEKMISLDISPTDHRLDLISNICRLIVKSLTIQEQQEIVNRYGTVLSASTSETNAVLIMSIFISLRPNVEWKISQNLVENLYNSAITGSNASIRQATCKFIAVALNKMNDDDECFQQMLSRLTEKITSNLQSDVDVAVKQATVILQIWLTKAVITKGSSVSESFLNNLTSILKHDQIGQYVAQEYNILTSEQEDALSRENFCNVRFLYKQRLFEHLIQQNSDFESSFRENYLTAVVHLLEQVPMELLLMHLTKLVPLLIESLSLDNEQLIFSTLTILKLLLDTEHVVFSEKAQSFIPRLLKLTTYRTMRVRITTLECLEMYCGYPTVLIITYKQDVLDNLSATLDDRKRLVRKAAARARTKWFLVGAPGGIEEQ